MNRRAKTAIATESSHCAKAMFALFVAFAMTAFAAVADDDLDQGLKVGATIPLDMAADDQNGDEHKLKSLPGRSGLILLFTRSLDW